MDERKPLPTADLMASSASMEQWSLTGGRFRCLAISLLRMDTAWSMCWPLTHSVTTLLLAMADPHPVARAAHWYPLLLNLSNFEVLKAG